MAPGRRVALVTGAAQGIGRSIAVELARRAYFVVLNDLRTADDTLRDVEAAGESGLCVAADVSQGKAVTEMVEKIMAAAGRIDVLVNNAGVSLRKRSEETTLRDWERVLSINLTAPFLSCREVGAVMLVQGRGSIVNIASIAGRMGFADRAAYSASKHGLVGLTRTLAVEWGGRGVRVNAVCPGWVKTPMDAADQAQGAYTDTDITDRIPMGRFATPEDVATAVAFLADPEASAFINGACLPVDGGWSADGGWDSLRLDHR